MLKGTGKVSYSGEKYAADSTISTLNARFHYAEVGSGKNQFLSYCHAGGTANVKKVEAGHMLFGLRITTQPHYDIIYECEQK